MPEASPKVLLVEDNQDNRELICWILEDMNTQASCAGTAEEGLDLLESGEFDLVLMDISLPGMSGKEATQKIRQNPRFADLPIIALTAHAIDREVTSIWESGVSDVLTKPVDENQLLEKMNAFLKKPE